jgi:hypothetical protein
LSIGRKRSSTELRDARRETFKRGCKVFYAIFGTALVLIGALYVLEGIVIVPGFDLTQAAGFGLVGFLFLFAAVLI